MPTRDRLDLAPLAVRCFLEQTYEPRELVILDDGKETLEGHIPADPRIRHLRVKGCHSVGQKRNMLCQEARGEIIIHWDDDDWSAPERMADEVTRLVTSGKAVTGYHAIFYYDVRNAKTYRYESRSPGMYACGTSQCYLRSWWRNHPFTLRNVGEDSQFSSQAQMWKQLTSSDAGGMMVARHHAQSTSKPPLGQCNFPAVAKEQLPAAFFEALNQTGGQRPPLQL